MSNFTSFQPKHLPLSPLLQRTRTSPTNLFLNPRGFSFNSHNHETLLRGSLSVVRFNLRPPPSSFPNANGADGMIRELFGRVEGLYYTLADAAVSNLDSTSVVDKQNGDWLFGVSNLMENVLKFLKDGLSGLHVPYAYGFAIILLTVLVKAATFPLSKKQVESAMAMRSLQPQVKAIQQRYAGDQERIQLETARLYKLARVNPLAGCLPTLATIPVWIGLYRALSNVANEGLLTEGFFWIPSLAGPTTIAAKQSGSGISWLFPFVDGHPPLGWSDTLAYLVLPVLLVVSQYISVQIMQSSQVDDPNAKSSQVLTKFLPLMIGYFSLSVPSGLSLYWFTNNILSTTQQIWFQKQGGAKNPVIQLENDAIKGEKISSQTAVTELNSTKVVESRERKSTSGGPSPGERFKQLKEQEARRKQQREEEQKKEAAKIEVINEKHKEDLELVMKEVDITERGLVNGKESSYKNLKKAEEDATYTATTTNNKVTGEDTQNDRREQPSKRAED
ncbi:hypothetical protein GIB67_004492 [Kingdonia uniflora]|uniref:Membrane insertase YidC/Oxa/ALB C-terminal domain-containing protein n=1 Tax=Kingdonia uniflora TaxID=39325 RepID=A0A7J7MRS2_9MAGN|nr:hypothetical protein GIB67_004492 [Kingdonia uniflora]